MYHDNPSVWPERFWAKVEKTETCWLWIAGRQADGYGSITVGGSGKLAHRVAYELVVGPIAKGLTLDHLCRVRHCVNPAHLEPVTNRVNILRGVSPTAQCAKQTSCKRGHPFTEANTRIKATPYGVARVCRSCNEEVLAPRRNAKRRKREPLITAGIAQDIYERAWAGESRGSIANHYGIGGTAVSNIKHGWSWSHVTGHVRNARSGGGTLPPAHGRACVPARRLPPPRQACRPLGVDPRRAGCVARGQGAAMMPHCWRRLRRHTPGERWSVRGGVRIYTRCIDCGHRYVVATTATGPSA